MPRVPAVSVMRARCSQLRPLLPGRSARLPAVGKARLPADDTFSCPGILWLLPGIAAILAKGPKPDRSLCSE